MQSIHQQHQDDMYVLDPYLAEHHHLQTLYHQQQQLYQQQQQQQHQQQQQQHHHQQQQQQRRVYGYQNYASSPSVASYVSPWEFQHIGYSSLDSYACLPSFDPYAAAAAAAVAAPVDFSSYPTTVHPSQLMMNPQSSAACSDSTLYSSYVSQTQHQRSQQQHIPTCIAPEDVFSPLTPLSDTDSSGSSDGASSPTSTTRHNSPTRLGLSIPTVSLVHPIANASWANLTPSLNTTSSGPSSTLSSPVESLSSHASSSDNDNEPSFVPPPSLKKSSASLTKANKRATRSAAPEPAWVEAVLASSNDDALPSTQSQVGPVRAANRPIAFACVFCRHRKIQCIRPKTEVAPGEKPPPCNQCEKRSRCCEYPPAALNPRGPIRRTTSD